MTAVTISEDENINMFEATSPPNGGGVCAVRDMVTGQSFAATDAEARLVPSHHLHPIVRARARAILQLVQLHCHVRDKPSVVSTGLGLTTAKLKHKLTDGSNFLEELFERWRLPRTVQGANCSDQFRRIQQAIIDLEHRRGRTMADEDWAELLSTHGVHAEVKATSDALFAVGATGPDDLLRLEFHLEVGDVSSTQALPRCIDCSFITEGLEPTDEVRQEEPKVAQQHRAAFAL